MKKIFGNLRDYIIITIGVLMVASGLYFFLMPNNIAAGGVNGLAMVINKFLPGVPVGMLMVVMNIILFVVAFLVIGTDFGARTIYASFTLSGAIWVLERIHPNPAPFTNDVLLELFFGIMIQGAGMGLIFNENASTGGTDILAKILHKFTHINIGKGVLLSDFVVTVLAGIAFGFQEGLYSLFSVTINGFVIDKMIEGLNVYKQIQVISSKNKEIEEFILRELGRGATVYYGRGAYTKQEIEVLCTIVDTKEFVKIRNYIKKIDPHAFVNVSDVHETLGHGFKDILVE